MMYFDNDDIPHKRTPLALLMQEHLAEERRELESQRETYQQDLERLRESTRAVEKEKERLEHQKKIKRKTIEVGSMLQSWKVSPYDKSQAS